MQGTTPWWVPWVFFLPHSSQTGYWRASNLEMLTGADKNAPRKKPAVLAKGLARKGQNSKIAVASLFQPSITHSKLCHGRKDWVGSQDFHVTRCNQLPSPPLDLWWRSPRGEPEFHPCQVHCQWRWCGKPGFHIFRDRRLTKYLSPLCWSGVRGSWWRVRAFTSGQRYSGHPSSVSGGHVGSTNEVMPLSLSADVPIPYPEGNKEAEWRTWASTPTGWYPHLPTRVGSRETYFIWK